MNFVDGATAKIRNVLVRGKGNYLYMALNQLVYNSLIYWKRFKNAVHILHAGHMLQFSAAPLDGPEVAVHNIGRILHLAVARH